MNDRELLEMAAKAVGYKIVKYHEDFLSGLWCEVIKPEPEGVLCRWNPLENDGDALRLAVKLHIDFKNHGSTVRVFAGDHLAQRVVASIEEACGQDQYAATRRAIVKAAAEIGRGMK